MKRIVILCTIKVVLIAQLVSNTHGLKQQFCPLPKRLGNIEHGEAEGIWDSSQPQLVHLNQLNGTKLQIQFFYPNSKSSALRSVEDISFESETESTTIADSEITTNRVPDDDSTLKSFPSENVSGEKREDPFEIDVFCNWEFKTSNSTNYLLLTFNSIIAPYSEECEKAYVSLQKENGFVSKWCGNRSVANRRPMSIFSMANIKLTVFRKGSAPVSPTGFHVTVEAITPEELSKHQPPLRLLLVDDI